MKRFYIKDINVCRDYSTEARWVKNKVMSLYFDINYFDLESLRGEVVKNFRYNTGYSILIKLKYNSGDFGMASKQIPFKMSSSNKEEKTGVLYEDINNLIDGFSERYRVEYIDIIQILYIITEDIPELKLKNINKVILNKEFNKVHETRTWFNSKSLPLTSNTDYYGELLTLDQAFVYLNVINECYKALNKDPIDINDVGSVYLYEKKYIILNIQVSSNTYIRKVYSAISGNLYLEVKDVIINNNTFTRTIGKSSFTISNNNVIGLASYKELLPIKNHYRPYKASSNPFIGTLDLEAYEDNDGYAKVYAIGFYTKREHDNNKSPKTFFINKERDSSEIVLKCIDSMLSGRYNNYTFYTHNLGGYDAVFLVKILTECNLSKGYDYYRINALYRDNKILKLEIKVSPEDKKLGFNKIVIVDSYNLLSGSLFNLSHAFGLDVVKGHFPHRFVKRNTLNYAGNTPSIEFWDKLSKEEYTSFFKKNWDLEKECINYLDKDLISLYKIMDTFNKYVYTNYGVQMTDALTISRLALNIFLHNFLKDFKIPVISQNMYRDIKKAYYGGLTEVYKPHGQNLYYYDVNSLYPFVALNSMPGINCTYIESFNKDNLNLNELFGYFYCEIETNDSYLGLLPIHDNFELIMPNGRWTGWYFSEELKFASDNGYKIKAIKGYNFNKEENVFKDYVDNLYKTKSISSGSIRVIAKSLLNNLLGRFGLNINKPITELINKDKLNFILSTKEVSSVLDITDSHVLITYNPSVSKDICNANDIDYIKVLNLNSSQDMEKDKEFRDVSLAIAAAVTSYARIYMSKIKLDIINNGGTIYYTDTDSIVSSIPLDPSLIGDKLGQFKLEHKVKEGYFISSKTYCLILEDDTCIIKAKGVLNNTLTKDDFINMYKGINVKASKQNTITNYGKGSVVIANKSINLNFNSYRKRVKIYDNNNWIDTKPLYVNTDKKAKDNVYSRGKKSYSSYSRLSDKITKKYFLNITNILYDRRYTIVFYITILLALSISLYIYIPDLISLCNQVYSEYIAYIHKIKGDHLKWVLENRFSINNTTINNVNISRCKISQFINIEFKSEYKDYLSNIHKVHVLRSILNELSLNFQSVVNTMHNTPHLAQSLTEFLFEAREAHPLAPGNPLGIQGINHQLDEVISMLDTYLTEHRTQSLERLNYHSNIMYILVNKLSPSLI